MENTQQMACVPSGMAKAKLCEFDLKVAQQWCAGRVRRLAKNAKSNYNSGPPSIVAPQSSVNEFIPSPRRGKKETTQAVPRPPDMKLEKLGPIRKCDRISDLYLLGADMAQPGSFGVYHATRLPDGLQVVVKEKLKTRQSDPEQKDTSEHQEEQEWHRSIDVLMNLPENESIARIHEVLQDEKAYYIVMEKVPGVDLFEALHGFVKFTLQEKKAILLKLLHALKSLHEHGCIHRDLKLENIMIDSPILGRSSWDEPEETEDEMYSTMAIKIIDLDTVEAFSPKATSQFVVGTDQYIAQEAYAGRYSPASDIFAAGVIAYRLITGRFPFWNFEFNDWPGENKVGSPKMQELQERLNSYHVNFDFEPWPSIPAAKDLVGWMLQSDEDKRPTVDQALAHPFFEKAQDARKRSASISSCSTMASTVHASPHRHSISSCSPCSTQDSWF